MSEQPQIPSADTHRFDRYPEHWTSVRVQRLLHYGHIIPVSRGLTTKYVRENHPGWEWNELVRIFRSAGIINPTPTGGPPQVEVDVKAIHFANAKTWAVEWIDGTVTAR